MWLGDLFIPCGPVLACRLIALDKNLVVHPIGIWEVRIIAKAVSTNTRSKGGIMGAAGPIQVCASQPAGVEAAIHAVHSWYEDDGTESILLVDGSNAFNTLNWQAAL